jgi:hypothetical protein
MADIYAIFGTLILLGITYPAILITWWLLFPEKVEESRLRIIETPRKSFGLGIGFAAAGAIPAVLFFTLPSQFTQVLGWIWLVILLGIASFGAAGIASDLGLRVNWKNDGAFLSLGAFLRGAVIWELASAFPIIGWLLIIPVGTLVSMGAAVPTILRRNQKADTAEKAS